MTTEYRWSLGTLIGLPLLILAALVVLAATIWMFILWRDERKDGGWRSDAGLFLTLFITGALTFVTIVGCTAFGMWPYDSEYHQWRNTTGVVQTIDSRLLGDGGGGTTQRFVVTFTDGRLRSCDDTRCAEVHKGDRLTLACKRAWQWSGTHGYDCNYVSDEATR